jgi:hypothetical protein
VGVGGVTAFERKLRYGSRNGLERALADSPEGELEFDGNWILHSGGHSSRGGAGPLCGVSLRRPKGTRNDIPGYMFSYQCRFPRH